MEKMEKKIVAALFEDRRAAERAIDELRGADVPKDRISVLELHEDSGKIERDGDRGESGDREHDTKASGTAKGLATGGALGAIAGFGALLIPGVGPFIAAGAFAEVLGVAGSAAVTSGIVGAAAGGLTGALVDYGVDREHAEYYERRVREGAVLVLVDTSEHPSAYAPTRAILRAAGGQSQDDHERSEERARDHA